MGKALQQIRDGATLDDAALDSGYASHSGFRDAFSRTFECAPGTGRTADCILTARWESPLGPLWAAATRAGICLLEFDDPLRRNAQLKSLQRWVGRNVVPGDNEHLNQLRDELTGYFAGRVKAFRVPLVYPGTPFQRRVWEALLRIPYGETRSYERVACTLDAPKSCRAVARANATNRIAIVIPCHRVVNKNGQLGGYGGEIWRKQYLLNLEAGVAPAHQGCRDLPAAL